MGWILGLVSVLLSAGSMVVQGKQQRATQQYNANVDQAEAKAEQQAAFAEEESLRREQAEFFGRQRAAAAASGGVGGSLGLIARQDEVTAELDALNVRHGGQTRSAGLLSQARARRMAGSNAAREGNALAGAQLLQGGSSIYNNYRMSA